MRRNARSLGNRSIFRPGTGIIALCHGCFSRVAMDEVCRPAAVNATVFVARDRHSGYTMAILQDRITWGLSQFSCDENGTVPFRYASPNDLVSSPK